jgi:hypothetical protein
MLMSHLEIQWGSLATILRAVFEYVTEGAAKAGKFVVCLSNTLKQAESVSVQLRRRKSSSSRLPKWERNKHVQKRGLHHYECARNITLLSKLVAG